MKSEDVKALLARQVMEPVRFYDSIATIQEFGVDEVIEWHNPRMLPSVYSLNTACKQIIVKAV